jgi:lysophospholipase L1-like esterase
MNPQQLSISKRVFFGAIVVLMACSFLELALRVVFATQVGPHVLLYGTSYSRHQVAFDPKGVARQRAAEDATVAFHNNTLKGYTKYFPNQTLSDRDEFGNRIQVTVNSQGFRGKDFAKAKAPGVIRIVTLGASSTFGFRSHDDQTYPHHMEQILNAALQGLTTVQKDAQRREISAFEVINLGIPHLTSDEIQSLFLNEGLDLQPDFVTFYEGINDTVWREREQTTIGSTKESLRTVPFVVEIYRELRARLLSVALLGKLITSDKSGFTEQDLLSFGAVQQKRFLGNLQLIHNACKEQGCRFVVASQQATTMEQQRGKLRGLRYSEEQAIIRQKMSSDGQLLGGEANFLLHGRLMQAELEWAKTRSVSYVDVIGAMDLERHNLVSWVHLNGAGNRIVASVIAREIMNQLTNERAGTLHTP